MRISEICSTFLSVAEKLLTGGGALLGGLPELITDRVGAPCFIADNPIECVARGVDEAFKMSDSLLDGFEQVQLYGFH